MCTYEQKRTRTLVRACTYARVLTNSIIHNYTNTYNTYMRACIHARLQLQVLTRKRTTYYNYTRKHEVV